MVRRGKLTSILSRQSIPRASLSALPDELLAAVARAVAPSDLYAFASVARRFYRPGRQNTVFLLQGWKHVNAFLLLLFESPSIKLHVRELALERPKDEVEDRHHRDMPSDAPFAPLIMVLNACKDVRYLSIQNSPTDDSVQRSLVQSFNHLTHLSSLQLGGKADPNAHTDMSYDEFVVVLSSCPHLTRLAVAVDLAPSPTSHLIPPSHARLRRLTAHLVNASNETALSFAELAFPSLVKIDLSSAESSLTHAGLLAACQILPASLKTLFLVSPFDQTFHPLLSLFPRFRTLTNTVLHPDSAVPAHLDALPSSLRTLHFAPPLGWNGDNLSRVVEAVAERVENGKLVFLAQIVFPRANVRRQVRTRLEKAVVGHLIALRWK